MKLNEQIKIAFFGNSEFSFLVLEEMKKNGITPDLIVTTKDKPQGRKMIFTPTQTKVWAENNSVEYVEPEKLKDESFIKKISEYDLFIVASYGKIIPKVVIDIPKYKVLNIHPSLLPKYRGPSPLQEQILNDEKEVGVSIMLIDEQVDHGNIIVQKKVEIKDWPIGFNLLQETLAKEGAKLLSEIILDWVKNKIESKEQKHDEATFTKKVEKIDGFLDLSSNSYKNYLKFLAFEEWPKTYFEIEKKVENTDNKTIEQKKIRVIIKKATYKDNNFEILSVIPEGKKEMDYKSFLNGLK
ncbi:MAG: methionyl-tRNA formyltransferase [Candidatus Pacebacteria bacterium]|nr:methionyl-tRNA formyltransferase [Candidatus Paceibacterota bacterium]